MIDVPRGADELLRDIARTRWRLILRGEPFARTFGIEPRVRGVTARGLLHASSRLSQGRWLAGLAAIAANRAGDRGGHIVEFGTGAGISGLYLIAGLARAGGGHLTTFEGNDQLVRTAEHHMRTFIDRHRLGNVSFDIRSGRFEETVPSYFRTAPGPLDLVFVDGNHLEEPTLEFHGLARSSLAPQGIIIHDDIAWSPGMERAWRTIKETERCKITELMVGGRPSRGIVWVGEPESAVTERCHTDPVVERWIRRVVGRIRRLRSS